MGREGEWEGPQTPDPSKKPRVCGLIIKKIGRAFFTPRAAAFCVSQEVRHDAGTSLLVKHKRTLGLLMGATG